MTPWRQRGFSILAVPAALRITVLVLALLSATQQVVVDGPLHAWWDRQIMDVLGVYSPLLAMLMTVLSACLAALAVVLLLAAISPERGVKQEQPTLREAAQAGTELGTRFGARVSEHGSLLLLAIAVLLGLGALWTGKRLQGLGEPVTIDLASGAPLPQPGTLVLLQGQQRRDEALVLYVPRGRPARNTTQYLHFLPLHADLQRALPPVLLRIRASDDSWRQVSMPVEGVLGGAPRRAVVSLMEEADTRLDANVRELRADITRGNLAVRRWFLGLLAAVFALTALGYGLHQRVARRRA